MTRNVLATALWVSCTGIAPAADRPTAVAAAERLAAQAVDRAKTAPQEALLMATRALESTRVFDPTSFAATGRKGEVVEDVFVVARSAYRRHRARLYAAVGEVLGASGRPADGARFLRRAYDLDPAPSRAAFARSLVAAHRLDEARGVLLGAAEAGFDAPELTTLQAAVDAAGLPSVQAEIDRARIEALGPAASFRYGPMATPPAARLSSGALLRFDTAPMTLLYLADASCRSCSKDLETLKTGAPPDAQVVMVPASRDDDTALRRSLSLYRYDWPFLVGSSLQAALAATPPAVLVVARDNFVTVVVPSPLDPTLTHVLALLARSDVRETRPRPQWSRRPPAPPRALASPRLLPNGIAPGEDGAAQDEMSSATSAFDAKKPAEALALFESIAARGDGTLLPPEADYNKALCLDALGRQEEARRLLLGIGDSRFQDEVDRALERIGSSRQRKARGTP
jgi:tetratricopeptide (TPR) repeat protein